jgi:hypothetical protein
MSLLPKTLGIYTFLMGSVKNSGLSESGFTGLPELNRIKP